MGEWGKAWRELCRLAAKTGRLSLVRWCVSVPAWCQERAEVAFANIKAELEVGGVVVCYCLNSHHRTVGSLVVFMRQQFQARRHGVSCAGVVPGAKAWRELCRRGARSAKR